MSATTYIVAGGSSGIGLEITKQLLARDKKVIVMSRNAPDIIHEALSHIAYDVMSDLPMPELQGEIDGLFYCPGSILLKPIGLLKENDLLDDFRLNAIGAFRFIKAYKMNLTNGSNPGIVLFSSVAASTGMPYHASVAMSKGAVEGLTLSLAAELSPQIRVNCLAPSLTSTPLAQPLLNNDAKQQANAERHPLKRIGSATEIAALALFVMTEAKWMTGQIIGINGGLGTLLK